MHESQWASIYTPARSESVAMRAAPPRTFTVHRHIAHTKLAARVCCANCEPTRHDDEWRGP